MKAYLAPEGPHRIASASNREPSSGIGRSEMLAFSAGLPLLTSAPRGTSPHIMASNARDPAAGLIPACSQTLGRVWDATMQSTPEAAALERQKVPQTDPALHLLLRECTALQMLCRVQSCSGNQAEICPLLLDYGYAASWLLRAALSRCFAVLLPKVSHASPRLHARRDGASVCQRVGALPDTKSAHTSGWSRTALARCVASF